MANPFFRFKHFTVYHDRCAMKVTTDACLFGAWIAETTGNQQSAINNEQTGNKHLHLLDIGTGTGLLSLMVAQKTEGLIDAIEIDAAAAEQAGENIAASPWKEKFSVIQQDLLHWRPGKKYRVIFSNPPFYQNELKSEKAVKNLAHHDAGLTLQALLQFIHSHLDDNGHFFLLLPAKREAEIERLLEKESLHLQRKVFVQQTLKHPPIRVMIQGRRKKVSQQDDATIIIKNEIGDYTEKFTALLQDYYLYL